MKNAIITGYSSGIGKAICDALKYDYNIITLNTRLQEHKKIEDEIKSILKDKDIDLLINCAGVGVFKPHEEIGIDKIKEVIDVNLVAPIILSNLLLRSLKKTKGHIINISSIESTRHSKFSALYTATKSGLKDFSLCLFEELRKSDVRVTNINPDLTMTNFFDEFNFKPSDDELCHIKATDLAKQVKDIILSNYVVTDITIRPQRLSIEKKPIK